MRALDPRTSGHVFNPVDGVRIYYEVSGPEDSEQAIVFLPTWNIIHSRVWKFQVPYFAQRGFKVLVYDPRGNGKSDQPTVGYDADTMLSDGLAAIEAAGIERATFVGLSQGAIRVPTLAYRFPELVERLVLLGGGTSAIDCELGRAIDSFNVVHPDRESWHKFNRHHWLEDYPDFLEWFHGICVNEPHSTKEVEDTVQWSLDTTAEVLLAGNAGGSSIDPFTLAPEITCPVLIVHGINDQVIPVENAYSFAGAFPDSYLALIDGGGHNSAVRDPVRFNELVHDFIGRPTPRLVTWSRGLNPNSRALFVSSPIGLGHVQRDLAIAQELRRLVPELHIDWLAQSPVREFLEERGEHIHPRSDLLAGEAAHIESETTGEHRLNIFQAIRDMDEILLNNFHVFLDTVRETRYNVWICDEAWEVDHFLFENPELKTAPYVWLTDVAGYLPAHEESVTDWERYVLADYNAELVNHLKRYPALRDRSFFLGEVEDLPDESLGPGLPGIRQWVSETHEFTGYVQYIDHHSIPAVSSTRSHFNLDPDSRLAIASAGGTSVGEALLRRIIESWPVVQSQVPDLNLLVIAGPRIDPAALPAADGVNIRSFTPNLHELMAAADIALVQGGLGTTMELVELQKPFLYFPLQDHYEQQRHVSHRLERHGVPASARIQFRDLDAQILATSTQAALQNPLEYSVIEPGSARNIAERIAPLIGKRPDARVQQEASLVEHLSERIKK